jgi:hypothetical protein
VHRIERARRSLEGSALPILEGKRLGAECGGSMQVHPLESFA